MGFAFINTFFSLSVIGTFLVRSGILTSVHTFALDPARGIYILTFVALLGGYSLILFGLKSKNFLNRHYFSFFSREGSILVNNIIMIVVCASVFLGTIYPLLVEVFSNNKISVGEPYFNSVTIPIMIPAILVMGMGPMLSWGKVDIIRILTKSLPSILLAAVISSIFFWIYGSYNMLGLAGIFLAFWIISNILLTTIQQLIVKNKEVAQNNIPKYSIEMITAHLGVALLILGITGSSIWQKEKIIRMKVNDKPLFIITISSLKK
jgi:cytochrome c-type biogenesis protein CcmF